MPSLSPDDIQILEARELATALQKIHDGKRITARERELIDRAAERGARQVELPLSDSEKIDSGKNRADDIHDTGGGKWGRNRIAEFYRVGDEPLSLRTIDRCNAIGRLPDVGEAPPWSDPRGMAEWYRVHYRSDITKPAKAGGKKTLPAWILAGMERGRGLAGAVPVEVVRPVEAVPWVAVDLPEMGDGVATAREVLEGVYRRYQMCKNDRANAPAAERAYLDALEKVQQAEDRARKSGDSELVMRAVVEEKIDKLHRRLPEHLAAELSVLRVEVHRASQDPAAWAMWCREFFAAVGERLVGNNFSMAAAA